ncbi:MAG: YceD family protein [Flavobacteriaceae bacterium]
MECSSEYTIPFVGLKNGLHQFKFPINGSFFDLFDYEDFLSSALEVILELEKQPTLLNLHFRAQGFVKVPCDLTNEPFDLPLDTEFSLVVKFGSAVSHTDEILILPEGSYQVDVQQYIYEMIVLAVPVKKVHPGIADGSLKSDILDKLNELAPKATPETEQTDPRWDKLKDLL